MVKDPELEHLFQRRVRVQVPDNVLQIAEEQERIDSSQMQLVPGQSIIQQVNVQQQDAAQDNPDATQGLFDEGMQGIEGAQGGYGLPEGTQEFDLGNIDDDNDV